MPEAGIEQQVLGKRLVLHEGRAQLGDLLADRDTVVDRHRCAAESRQQAALLGGVRLEKLVIVPMLVADVQSQAVVRERRGGPVLAELTGNFAMQRAQGRSALAGAL